MTKKSMLVGMILLLFLTACSKDKPETIALTNETLSISEKLGRTPRF